MERLNEDLSKNISTQSITSLCCIERDKVTYGSFQYASVLFPILSNLMLLFKTHPTNTFSRFWKEQVAQYKGTTLSLKNTVSLIWEPAFKASCQYLESLKDRSILLVKVDELLHQYESMFNLTEELMQLEKGISGCLDIQSDTQWIKACVQRMKDYQSLNQYATAADVFLQLKDTLGLTEGDFKVVQELADKVRYTSDYIHYYI